MKHLAILISIPMLLKIRIPSKILGLIFLYIGWVFISCIYNRNLEPSYFYILIEIIVISVISDYYMRGKHHMMYIKALFLLLICNIIINFFTLIVFFPDGMYIDERGWEYNYYLGYKNLHIYSFLPCLMLFSILQFNNKKKRLGVSFYALLFLIFISCLLNHSTTSFVVIAFFSMSLLFLGKRKLPKWINPCTLFLLMTIASIILVLGTITGDFSEYTEAIADKTDKSGDSMAARGIVWLEALYALYEHPIIGNGYFSVVVDKFTEYFHMHNNYLDVITQGGIVGFVVFLSLFFVVSRRMKLIHDTWLYNILLFIFFSVFIEFTTEGKRDFFMLYPMLIISYHISYLYTNHKIIKVKIHENHRSYSRPLQVK